MLGAFSIDAYLPSFPAIGESLGVTRAAVQQTLTVYLFTFAFMMIFYGTLSDTFGRKPVVVASVAGYVLGSAGAALAPGYGWLLVFRAVQGLSAGGGAVVGAAIVRDLYPGSSGQRVMAYVKLVFSLAPAIAPVAGGWLQVLAGWRAVFVFLTLVSLAMLVATVRVLPESLPAGERQPAHPGRILRSYVEVGSHGRFMLQIVGMGMCFGGFSLYVSTAPDFVMKVLRLPETAFAWLFIPIIIGMSLGSLLSARLAGRMAPGRLIAMGFAVMGGTAVLNLAYAHLFVPVVPWAVLTPMFYMFGISMASPAMSLQAMDVFPEMRGMAASFQGFVQMILFATISGTVAPLVYGDAKRLAWCLLAGWVISAVCWGAGTRRRAFN